jgi:integrase
MFIVGIRTGLRISEVLSLRWSDVWGQFGVLNEITIQRCNVKRKTAGRRIPVHRDVIVACMQYRSEFSVPPLPDDFVFRSDKGVNQPIGRRQAWNILKQAFQRAGVFGSTGTHCLRKTFAGKMYDLLGHDIVMTQRALGHVSVVSTAQYIAVDEDDVNAAILKAS